MDNMTVRRIHKKSNSKSLLFNIPLDIAKKLNMVAGDFISVGLEGSKVIISKVDLKEGV